MNDSPEQNFNFEPDFGSDINLHSSLGRYIFRFLLISFATVMVCLVVAAVGLLVFLQGNTFENASLNNQVRNSIISFIGPQYNVQLAKTKFEFRNLGHVSIISSDVEVYEIGEDDPIATIGEVLVGIQPVSLIKGQLKINTITIKSSKLDLSQFPFVSAGFSTDMNNSLKLFSQKISQMRGRLVASELQQVAINNSQLIGFLPGQYSTGKIAIEQLYLDVKSPSELNMRLVGDSGISKFNADAAYKTMADNSSLLELNFDGLDIREWMMDPADIDAVKRFASSNSITNGQMKLAFNSDHSPQQPVARINIGEGKLRFGKNGETQIDQLALNFRIIPQLNRIILERSGIKIGGFQAQIVGGITPVDENQGLSGNFKYTLVVEHARGQASQNGEKPHFGSMIMEGDYLRARQLLTIDQFKLLVDGGTMVGSGSLGFEGETPSVVFNGVSNSMPTSALKQYWPIFMVGPLRRWVQEHVHGGKITSAIISASIPAGIIGRLRDKKRIGDDQLSMDIKFADIRFDTFGKLPPLRQASGTLIVEGMRAKIVLDKALAYAPPDEPVKIKSGIFIIKDFAQRPLNAYAKFLAHGPISSIARISNAKPLNVMNKIDMTPAQWSGHGEINLTANFPLKKNTKSGEVDWQADIRLIDAKSSKPIAGRKVTHVNVNAKLTPQKAIITGKSTIDGISGIVHLIEPVGKSSNTKLKRTLTARMDKKQRHKIGLFVEPVITGLVDVVMEQHEGHKVADIGVDLKKAKISLPWIGWAKGVDIPASAKFKITLAKDSSKIHDLIVKGKGFHLKGDMIIDKNGVLSAVFPKVMLNQDDAMSVRIKRKKGVYSIVANGDYFDGRGLVNKLFHNSRGTSDKSNASFNLSANIKQVKGFGKRYAENLSLDYSVKKGWLDALSLDAHFTGNRLSTVRAQTKAQITGFKIRCEDAGSSLSFLNLYKHMNKGKLSSDLKRKRNKPFIGDVLVEDFVVTNEPMLKKLISSQSARQDDPDGRIKKVFSKIKTNSARFLSAQSSIEKGIGYLKMNGSLTGVQIGLTYNGTIFDANNKMNINGTFMPAFGISRLVSAIPFVGQILSNGKDSGLIGINYHLSGPTKSPKIEFNPLSIVAPGIFKKVFQPQKN